VATGCRNILYQDEERLGKLKSETQDWEKERKSKDQWNKFLEKAREYDKVKGTIEGTLSRILDNCLSFLWYPGKEGVSSREHILQCRKEYSYWGNFSFDNLPASKLSLPAKLSQSLFNGKPSPKGSRCGWNQFKCAGVDTSFGNLPPFFFLLYPAGAQWPPPTSNQGIASCSSPWVDLSKLFLLKI
jgi:hypothetical protein